MSEKKRRKPIPVVSAQEASAGYIKRVARVDRLCVIAAGVLSANNSDRVTGETFDAYVVRLSRSILAKLEEE